MPLFFPLPPNPPLSSIPAQSPGFPSISPRYLSVPSKPRDSILTLSPTSNAFLGFPTTSEWRLGGRLTVRVEVGVLACSEILLGGTAFAEEAEEAEDGRPTTDRRPEDKEYEADWGDKDIVELRPGCGMLRCSEGSFALIASAKARDISSTGVVGLSWFTVEEDRDLPGVGMLLIRPRIPDCLELPGVAMSETQILKLQATSLKAPNSNKLDMCHVTICIFQEIGTSSKTF